MFAHRDVFNGFSAHVHEGRWGTVLNAAQELLKVANVLRRAWDLDAFMMGNRFHGAGDDGGWPAAPCAALPAATAAGAVLLCTTTCTWTPLLASKTTK